MAMVTDSPFIDILIGLILIVGLVYWFLTNNDDYWDKRGVPNIKKGFFLDSVLGRKSQAEGIKECYNKFLGERFIGLFQLRRQMLMIMDENLIHKILVKDFTHFQDRGQPQFKNDSLSQSLFNLEGQVWRALRYKLTPTFTTGKLKGMFEQVSKCGDNMNTKLEELSSSQEEVDSKAFVFEFTLDVISSCAFGVQFKPNTPDFIMFQTITQRLFKATPATFFRFSLAFICPKLVEYLKLSPFPKEISDYFINLTRVTAKYRKDNNIQRNDYFQLLLTLKEQEENGKDMGLGVSDATEDDDVVNQMQYTEDSNQPVTSNIKLFTESTVCANTFIFLLAGSESVAATLNFVLYELSQHPEIQQQLQQEVDSVLARHGQWSYDAVKEMTFLDQVIQETQRIYPVVPILLRSCIKPYKMPDSDLVVEKDTLIGIPVSALHMDPQHYPEPEQFRPDRFKGNNFKPNPTYMPFGDGPRICIAMRFAVVEMKTCVARVMSQYTVKLGSKTQLPLKFDPRSFFPAVKGGIWVKFEKRMSTST